MGRKLTDEEIRHPEAIEKISHLIGAMTPFVSDSDLSRLRVALLRHRV